MRREKRLEKYCTWLFPATCSDVPRKNDGSPLLKDWCEIRLLANLHKLLTLVRNIYPRNCKGGRA